MVEVTRARLFAKVDESPFGWFEEMRDKGPVLWDEHLQGWLILSYDICQQVFRDETSFAHNYSQIDPDTLAIKGGANIVSIQGEAHHRLHRWAVQIFSPRNLAAYRDHVRLVVDGLFDAFMGRCGADLRTELCEQVPGRSMMAMMGMPWGDDDLVRRLVVLHETIMVYLGKPPHAATPSEKAAAMAASNELNALLLPALRARRKNPGDDLLSRLWAEAPSRLEVIDEQAMLANAREFFLGGFDTTVHALSNGIHTLLTRPDLRRAVSLDRGKTLDTFIEEVLRVFGVVQHRMRIATVNAELGGVSIKAGDRLVPVLTAANRDPGRFGAHPEEFDLARGRPHEHLAFITGPRSCPGAPLARAEARLVFEAFLDRLKNVRLDPEAPPPRFMGGFTRSWRPLNILFDKPV